MLTLNSVFSLEIRNKLDAKKYHRLNPDATARDANEFLSQHLNDVMLLLNPQTCISYGRFIQVSTSLFVANSSNEIISLLICFCWQLNGGDVDRDVIIEYSKLVGRVCAQRMLYVNMSWKAFRWRATIVQGFFDICTYIHLLLN